LPFSFFMDDNLAMSRIPIFLHVELRTLQELQVIHSALGNPDKVIRPAFKMLRQCVTEYGLDPDTLLHVGIPELSDGMLISYDCCIEFSLPESLDEAKILPGGRYAVLTVEKTPSKIASAIRSFHGDYLSDHGLVLDEERPVYEIYFKDTLEYCVPIR
jgi:DNA gyrase inhibitor GyrI